MQCSVPCGGGVQRRLVKCVNTQTGLAEEDSDLCSHEAWPESSRPCATEDCELVEPPRECLLTLGNDGEKDGWELENHLDVGARTAAVLFTVGSNHMVTVTGRPQGAKVQNWESAKGNPSYPGILQPALLAPGSGRSLLISVAASFSPLGS